ncbi:hypothetical protein E1A91_A13G136800v1 [Gossypium mustelinum]|uniref:Uncharacterized protein n=1 Tax=Gossypium mustelinum TaxID=34275 RepID=A0A5D2WH69_GOSMU|nr:hypothetical protein E1A91_A13G136800v1 [Gossypium mustelinum]TYJ01196.1 hypothetical protein E1A91_A13G136800v1 [Gossypium mustelinum]TYJ01197.1 hypothetical protein E1A91_A13G136800v1 [Gossypium mustelinum]
MGFRENNFISVRYFLKNLCPLSPYSFSFFCSSSSFFSSSSLLESQSSWLNMPSFG